MSDRETYFEDLSPCAYIGDYSPGQEKLKAVRWLAWARPYRERGTELSEKLRAGLTSSWLLVERALQSWRRPRHG